MLAIKISLTIMIVAGLISALMIISDSDRRWTVRYDWWPTLGGLMVLTTIFSTAASMLLAVWQVIP